MAVNFVVSASACLVFGQSIFFSNKVINNKLKAPTAPASVGVNQPRNNPPSDMANTIRTSMTPPARNAFILSSQLAFGTRGNRDGLILVKIIMVIIYTLICTMPGITPAAKSRPIDCSVAIPYTINITLGGIREPREEPAAMLTAE